MFDKKTLNVVKTILNKKIEEMKDKNFSNNPVDSWWKQGYILALTEFKQELDEGLGEE